LFGRSARLTSEIPTPCKNASSAEGSLNRASLLNQAEFAPQSRTRVGLPNPQTRAPTLFSLSFLPQSPSSPPIPTAAHRRQSPQRSPPPTSELLHRPPSPRSPPARHESAWHGANQPGAARIGHDTGTSSGHSTRRMARITGGWQRPASPADGSGSNRPGVARTTRPDMSRAPPAKVSQAPPATATGRRVIDEDTKDTG
jgi:hypothetical protein